MTLTKWIYLLSLHKVLPIIWKKTQLFASRANFLAFAAVCWLFSKINFQKIISEHYQSVKLFGTRSGPRKSCPGLGPNCCIGYLSRLQKSQIALIMKKLQELFIKHKYILVLKIMSAAYFQMNLRLLLSWKQTLWIQIRLLLRELSNLDPYLSSVTS